MKTLARLFLRLWFRFRTENEAVLDTAGPVLLIPNHVSWLDWLFIGVCLDKDWKVVTSQATANLNPLYRFIMVNDRTFPIDPMSPFALKRMAEHLEKGGRLVLFAEGRLSRTGSLMKLFEGTGFLITRTGAKVITAYLRGAERCKVATHSGWKLWRPQVSVHFSESLTAPKFPQTNAVQLRQKLTGWLRDRMAAQRFEVEMREGAGNLLAAIGEMASLRPHQVILEDATRQTLTYRRLFAGAEFMAAEWRKRLGPDETRVGVLLPNLATHAVALLSLWRAGRTPAILNYTAGPAILETCARLATLKHVITSRAFVERAKIDLATLVTAGIEPIFFEDVKEAAGSAERFAALGRARAEAWRAAAARLAPDTPAAVLFTSGSEATPKGVVLTHRNLLANIRQVLTITDLEDRDRAFTALPLFHSFGLTLGLLLPLVRGCYTYLYVSPLHYRVVPGLFYDADCTILLATNTFLNGYARKAHPYDFRSLRYLFAGAEKIQTATADLWARRFGVRVLEGYGATECSPCLSVNTPLEPRFGSAGRLLPGMEWKLEKVPGIEEGGRLYVKGPNVMAGYLNPEPDATFKSLGGWYDTGDLAKLDEDGFISLLGRQKRFAKISGEMVSLTAVEDACAGAFPRYSARFCLVVLTRPDEKRGEALIAVVNDDRCTLEEVREAVKKAGLSNLAAPRELKFVRNIPRLGSGKADYRALEKMLNDSPPKA